MPQPSCYCCDSSKAARPSQIEEIHFHDHYNGRRSTFRISPNQISRRKLKWSIRPTCWGWRVLIISMRTPLNCLKHFHRISYKIPKAGGRQQFNFKFHEWIWISGDSTRQGQASTWHNSPGSSFQWSGAIQLAKAKNILRYQCCHSNDICLSHHVTSHLEHQLLEQAQ